MRSFLSLNWLFGHSIQFEITPGETSLGFLLMAVFLEETSLLLSMHAGIIAVWYIWVLFFAGVEDTAAHPSGSPPHQ